MSKKCIARESRICSWLPTRSNQKKFNKSNDGNQAKMMGTRLKWWEPGWNAYVDAIRCRYPSGTACYNSRLWLRQNFVAGLVADLRKWQWVSGSGQGAAGRGEGGSRREQLLYTMQESGYCCQHVGGISVPLCNISKTHGPLVRGWNMWPG